VVIVVFDGAKLLDAAGPAEVFAEANRFGAKYSLEVASVDGRDVTTSIGTRFGPRMAGFGSTETLRRVFLSHLGISPKADRDRFRTEPSR
jgi:transcriptional regulator GlxA family with amidase domain